MRAMQKAFKDSASHHPTYRKLNKMRMRVKKLRRFETITTALARKICGYLLNQRGDSTGFLFGTITRKGCVRIIKDNIRDKKTLLRWLRRLGTVACVLHNGCLDESAGYRSRPHGKRGRNKFRKKRVGLTNLRPITTIFVARIVFRCGLLQRRL